LHSAKAGIEITGFNFFMQTLKKERTQTPKESPRMVKTG
jgi:hypothetical protein